MKPLFRVQAALSVIQAVIQTNLDHGSLHFFRQFQSNAASGPEARNSGDQCWNGSKYGDFRIVLK
jgi:hypothetical protein